MAHRTHNRQHRIDRKVAECDPIHRRVPASHGIDTAFDLMTASIARQPRRRPTRIARRPRALLVFVAALGLLGAGGAAATRVFVPTRPHGMIMGRGVGELINVDGTDFRRVALEISSDISYPPGYGSWRNSVISWEYENQQDACMPPVPGCMPKMPAGQLHGAFAASACGAWVVDWRNAMMAGRTALAARDARVIAGALRWKAISAEDPHPSMSTPGDMGTTQPSQFGWMIPIIQAVGTGDLARVDRAIVSDTSNGGQFSLVVGIGTGIVRGGLVGRALLGYLNGRVR